MLGRCAAASGVCHLCHLCHPPSLYGAKSSFEEYGVKDVLTNVRLEIQDNGKFVFPVNDFLQKFSYKRKRQWQCKEHKMMRSVAGTVIIEVDSQEASSNDSRRNSGRKR